MMTSLLFSYEAYTLISNSNMGYWLEKEKCALSIFKKIRFVICPSPPCPWNWPQSSHLWSESSHSIWWVRELSTITGGRGVGGHELVAVELGRAWTILDNLREGTTILKIHWWGGGMIFFTIMKHFNPPS